MSARQQKAKASQQKGWKYFLDSLQAWCLRTTVPLFSALLCPGLSQSLGAELSPRSSHRDQKHLPRTTKQPEEPQMGGVTAAVWGGGLLLISPERMAGTAYLSSWGREGGQRYVPV